MMPTLLILGGMLLMLQPYIEEVWATGRSFFGVSQALRRSFPASIETPPEMTAQIIQMDRERVSH